jgi:hypothetical protein
MESERRRREAVDLDEIWRSDWTGVPGFSPEPLARDWLDWLVYGKLY